LETWHFIEHITSQRIDGRELRVEVEGDLDLLLNGWGQKERAHDPLGLSPARGVRGVREMNCSIPRFPLNHALGGLPATVIGLQPLIAACAPNVASDEAELSQREEVTQVGIGLEHQLPPLSNPIELRRIGVIARRYRAQLDRQRGLEP
jgi:hypothetical protein